jgi:hypothetical protein
MNLRYKKGPNFSNHPTHMEFQTMKKVTTMLVELIKKIKQRFEFEKLEKDHQQ